MMFLQFTPSLCNTTLIHSNVPRRSILSYYLLYRSILSVPEASSVWNGTFRCLAENVAGNQVQ